MTQPMTQPTAFSIVHRPDAPSVATNGSTRLMCLDAGGKLSLRRAICGGLGAPTAERIVPALNALAGELLANSAMPPADIAARLHALQQVCQPPPARHMEWAYAELDGVRCYTDGVDVILTKQDLSI